MHWLLATTVLALLSAGLVVAVVRQVVRASRGDWRG